MSLATIERLESNIRGYVRSFPVEFDTAVGSWLSDVDGRLYLDFFAGAGTLNYGHNNPLAVTALQAYLGRNGVMHGLDTATRAKTQFLEKFSQVILQPRSLDYKVQFTGPTGTNAVEAAIKLARKMKQRSHVVAFTNAYHGHSLGSLALTGNQYYHNLAYGSHNNVTHLPFDGYLGDYDTSNILEKMLDDGSSGLPKPAAVILETIQGEGGVNVASNAWLQRIATICKQHDVLLIADEVQVGNGRTGTFFSFEPSGIRPDIVCLSKAIGGGLPMSIILIDPNCDVWQPGEHTGTFRGNNHAFVAAHALLDYWCGDDFVSKIAQRSALIQEHLSEFVNEFGAEQISVRGRGMIWGIETRNAELANQVCREAFQRGLMVETSGARDQVVKLLPPLTTLEDDLRLGLNILRDSFRIHCSPASRSKMNMPNIELPSNCLASNHSMQF